MNWKTKLSAIGLLWLRVMMGLGIANHGYGKLFGGRMEQFAKGIEEMGLPMPTLMAWAAASSEFFGGILVAIGLATRPAAAAIFITMAVAAFIRHRADPLQVKELALAYWTIAGALVLTGPGPFSLDSLVCRKWRQGKTEPPAPPSTTTAAN